MRTEGGITDIVAARNVLDELPIVDNWQRLTPVQQAAQKADSEARRAQNTPSTKSPQTKADNHDVYHQLKQAMEPIKFSAGKLMEGVARKGVTNAAHGMSSTLSWLEGALFAPAEALTGFDDLQEQHGLFYNRNSAIEVVRDGQRAVQRGNRGRRRLGNTAKGAARRDVCPSSVGALKRRGRRGGADTGCD